MYFEVFKSPKNQQYWFVIKSHGNHSTLAISEMYTRKENAFNAIQVIVSSTEATYYDKTGE